MTKKAATEESAAAVAPEAISTGLTAIPAQVACDHRAEQEFRFGYKPHWIVGRLVYEIRNDRWVFKVEADVKNAYNAEAKVNVECLVSGTDEAPVVAEFNAY